VAKASSMLYSESCNPEPGWALELAGVDLEVSRLTLSSPTAVERGSFRASGWSCSYFLSTDWLIKDRPPVEAQLDRSPSREAEGRA
jgi:hypothetical protein